MSSDAQALWDAPVSLAHRVSSVDSEWLAAGLAGPAWSELPGSQVSDHPVREDSARDLAYRALDSALGSVSAARQGFSESDLAERWLLRPKALLR